MLIFQGDNEAWFPLVLRIVGIGHFYDLPTSVIFTTSVNTPSQTSQTVGDFYDVIGRIGSVSTLKILSQTFPGDFYDECEHEICLSDTSGMFDLVFTCYQGLIFSEL